MAHTRRGIAAAVTLAALVSGQDRAIPYPVVEPPAWQAAVEAGTRSLNGSPGPEYWTDHARYRIDATLEPATATLRGTASMTYVNRSPDPLRSLVVHLRQNLHRQGAARNRFVEITGGVELGDVTLDGETARYRTRGTVMYVRLPRAIPRGGETTLDIDWSFVVPRAGRAPRMGHEDHHVFFLGYWYPQFAVRDDIDGWVGEQYLGRAEFYMGYADYELTFRAPPGWIVTATGQLENADEVLTEKAIGRLASAMTGDEIQHVVTEADLEAGRATRTAPEDELLAWRFRASNVRDVAVSLSDRYLWDATRAIVPGRDEPCAIHAVYEADSPTWPRAAEFARHTIQWMSERVLPYPWPHMTACEGVIGGGMEYPMMTIIGDTSSVRGLQGVIGHELIHMWFPMIVGSNEKRHPWMDEGTNSFLSGLVSDDFWDRSTALKRSVGGYIGGARRGEAAPMMTHGDYFPSGYSFAAYSKQSALLHQLRELLRDGERDVLLEAIRTYAAEWAFGHPSPYDLFRTVERVAGQDLDWYWRPWYFETWTLDHEIGSVFGTEDSLRVTIEDRGTVPFPCTVVGRWPEGRTEVRTVPVEHWLGGATTAEVEFPPGATEIIIDPDWHSLDVERDGNTWRAVQ